MDGQKSIGELLRDALSHIQEIIRSEMRLARAEVKEEIATAKRGAAMFAIGGVCGLFAAGFLLLSAVYFLSLFLPSWAAALLVAAVVGIAAAVMLGKGRQAFKEFNVVPQRTVRTVKEDVEWAKHRAS